MDTVSANQLVADHLTFAHNVAIGMVDELNLRPLLPVDDAVAYGAVGLAEAAQRFQSGRGASFQTFSFPRIRGAIIDGLRKSQRSRLDWADFRQEGERRARRTAPLPRRQDVTSDGEPFDSPAESPFEAIARRDLLSKALQKLSHLEREIVILYYKEDLTCEQIAVRLRASKSWISRVRHRALESLKTYLQTGGLQ